MLRMKHMFRLGREILAFAVAEGAWWLIPLMVLLAIITLAVATTQITVPYAVYTLF